MIIWVANTKKGENHEIETTKFVINMPVDVHKKLKALASCGETTMTDIVVGKVKECDRRGREKDACSRNKTALPVSDHRQSQY